MQLLVETQQYIYDVMSVQASLFQSCVSRSPNCASFALNGDCTSESPVGWLKIVLLFADFAGKGG
jgi:hypothetical protein